jgi:hypothetical protein
MITEKKLPQGTLPGDARCRRYSHQDNFIININLSCQSSEQYRETLIPTGIFVRETDLVTDAPSRPVECARVVHPVTKRYGPVSVLLFIALLLIAAPALAAVTLSSTCGDDTYAMNGGLP